jgi:Cu(I)/Ag(I) efflux system membrane fusion protein
MNRKTFILVLLAVVLAGSGGYALYRLGVDRGATLAVADTASANATGKKVLYWHDPMVPGQKFDKPGKSPFMDMQLVPVYADVGDEGSVAISPRVQQNLGVRITPVTQGTLRTTVEAVGSAAYNERDVAVVQARSNGFLERLYVRAPLDAVRQGQPLAELYVPDGRPGRVSVGKAHQCAGGRQGDRRAGRCGAAKDAARRDG